jgi:DNA primase
LQAPLIEYLINRSLDPLVLNAHFSLDPKFLNRVILPCSRDDKIIFWQARTILADVKPRYLSPSVNKDAVLWGYDFLWGDQSKPLFITEGIFDAASINGVALLGSTLNESKLQILNRCRRRKIVVVDRDDRGSALAQLALENGWEITWPAPGAADVNTSVQKFGVLLTTWYLLKQATVPSSLVSADGISVQSKLSLAMQTLKIKRRK